MLKKIKQESKSKQVIKSLLLLILSTSLSFSVSAADGPSKALFVYGGWQGHAPIEFRDIIVPWLESEGFSVTVSDTLAPYADEALMKEVDLIVQIWTQGTITNEELNGLLGAVENGAGIAGWHGGLGDAFHDKQRYEYMIGGQWVEHPGNDGTPFRVNITNHDDPLTTGLDDFDIVSEQYYMHVDPNNKVLATTTFSAEIDHWIDGATMPVIWKKMYGNGRVFYTALGHQPEVFDIPEAMTLLKRGILWASQSKYDSTPNLVSPMYPAGKTE